MPKLLVALLLLSSTVFSAPVLVYNNFGIGDSYETSTGWTLGFDYAVAMPFTPGVTVNLSMIELALFSVTGSSTAAITLLDDNAGLPGTSLETLVLSPVGSAAILLANSSSHPLLIAGETYWLAGDPGSGVAWNWNSTGVTGDFATWQRPGWARVSTDGAYSSNTFSAFRVTGDDGTAGVPEPATAALIGAALLGLGVLRRRTS